MGLNNFILGLIAGLKKAASTKQIKSDIKQIENQGLKIKLTGFLDKVKTRVQLKKDVANIEVPVKLTGKLDKSKTNAQLKQDSASLKGTVELTGKVNKGINTSVQQATQQAQKVANKKPIQVGFNLKKDKLINDIKVFGQLNSKMMKDANMAAKYNSLLDNAKLATSSKELKNLRLQLSAMRSEIKATHLNGLALGDTFKKTFKRATELFTSTGGLMLLTQQISKAWQESLNLDKSFTDLIKVQDELTRGDYDKYLAQCNKKAQDLATTQQSLIEGATEFSRSGYTRTESDKLAEKSAILQNVGDMQASDSAKAIISGVQAYDVVDGYTDAVDKAQALIDKYNEIGNTASITSAEIAQGVQAVGSVFKDANTDVDEFIALLAAGNRQFQDANSLSLGLRTAALRIRCAKVELEQMGEETDGVYTSASKLQEKIADLTNFNGKGGVKILEADQKTYRSIYDIFVDISKVYKDMSDVDQSALLELISGKHRASAISATISNMSEAQEIYQRSLNSAGSAQEEYDKYLQSSQASLEKFRASMIETYQSLLNGSTTKAILDTSNATLQFINSLGLLETSLKGFIAYNVVKAITTLSASFKTSALQASEFGKALKLASNVPDGNLKQKYTILRNIAIASKSLTDEQLKQVISSKALSNEDRVRILRLTGMEKSLVKAKMAEYGFTQSTRAQTAAQNSATISTFSLTAAVKGFSNSVKMAFVNNPVTASIMLLSTLFGILSTSIDKAKQKAEEARQTAIELTNTYKQEKESLDSKIESYKELKQKLDSGNLSTDETRSIKEQLLEIQKSLIDSFGDEASNIDLVNGKYKEQIGLLGELSKEKATDYIKENRSAFETAKKELEKVNRYQIGSLFSYDSNKGMTEEQKQFYEYIKSYSDLFEIEHLYDTSTLSNSDYVPTLFVKANADDAKEVIDKFYDDVEKYIKDNNLQLDYDSLQIDLSKVSSDIETDDALKEYRQIYDEFMKAEIVRNDTLRPLYQQSIQAVEDYNNALSNGVGVNDAKSRLDALQQSVQNATSELEGSQEIFDDIYSGINKDAEAVYNLKKAFENNDTVKEYAEQLRGLTDIDLKAINLDNDNIENGEEAFRGLIETLGLTKEQVQSLIDKLVELEYVQGASSQTINETPPSFLNEWSSLADDTKDKLLSLAKSGELSAKTLESTEEYADLLEAVGGNAELAQSKIMNMLDSTEKLSAASDGIGSLENAYNEMKDDGFVLAKTLESLPDVFKDLEGFKSFSEIVGNPQNTADEMQQAFNDIASEYLITQGTLSGLVNASESEIQTYIANLKAMGITNAENVVNQTLQILNENNKLISEAEAEYTEKYNSWLEHKNEADLEYLKTAESNNGQLVSALGSAYKSDYDNWTSLLQKKIEAYNSFISALLKSQASMVKSGTAPYANPQLEQAKRVVNDANKNGVKDALKDPLKVTGVVNINNALNSMNSGKLSTKNPQYTQAQVDAAQSYIDTVSAYNNAVKQLQIDFSEASVSFDGFNFSPATNGSSGSKNTNKEFSEDIDWIETALSRIQREIDNLNKTVDATYKDWSTRNNALSSELSAITKEISLQQQAYNKYMSLANSVGLDGYYQELVKNGAIDYTTITDEDLSDKIKQFKDFYEKALDCQDAVIDLQGNIADLADQKISNITSEFDQLVEQLTHDINTIDKAMSLEETKGRMGSGQYYTAQSNIIAQQQDLLLQERANISSAMKEALSQGISVNSEQYRNWMSQLDDIDEQLQDNEVTIAENTKAIREINDSWFEYQQSLIDSVISEVSFVKDMLDYKTLLNDNGSFTKEGWASIGMSGANYDIAMAKADEYGKRYTAYKELSKQDPLNKDIEKLMQEALSNQQEALKEAMGYYDDIKSMVQSSLDKMIEHLQELSDDYMEGLNLQKDMYDYQKTINEQTKTIGDLRKQIAAYSADGSEETRATLQSLYSQLRDSEQQLQETEYDKWLSDQQTMIDNMMDLAQEWEATYLESFENYLSPWLEEINAHGSEIAAALTDGGTIGIGMSNISNAITDNGNGVVSSVDSANNSITNSVNNANDGISGTINIANRGVLDALGYSVSDNLKSVIDSFRSNSSTLVSYDPDAKSGLGTLNTTLGNGLADLRDNSGISKLSGIGALIEAIKLKVVDEKKQVEATATKTTTAVTKPATTTPKPTPQPAPAPTPQPSSPQGNGQVDQGDRVKIVSGRFYSSSDGKTPTGNSKGQWNGKDVYITKVKNGAKYPYHVSTGTKLGSGDLGWLKKEQISGYKIGGRNIQEELAWTQENGGEIIRRSDGAILTPVKGATVFNAQQTDALWKLSKSLITNSGILANANIPNMVLKSGNQTINNDVRMDITMNGVNDPETFANNLADSLNNNTRIKKIIQDNTLGVALGKNSLNGLRH